MNKPNNKGHGVNIMPMFRGHFSPVKKRQTQPALTAEDSGGVDAAPDDVVECAGGVDAGLAGQGSFGCRICPQMSIFHHRPHFYFHHRPHF